jgi:hypothetical protein
MQEQMTNQVRGRDQEGSRMFSARVPRRKQRDDEANKVLEFPGVGEPDVADAKEFRGERNRMLLRIMGAVAWPAAGAIFTFIVLFTVLGVMTILNGGVVPVGSGETGAPGVIRNLILLYTQGLGIAITIGVMLLAIAAPLLIIPWARRNRRQ